MWDEEVDLLVLGSGAGCQVGAGLTFGYVVAQHAAERDTSGVPAPRNPAEVHLGGEVFAGLDPALSGVVLHPVKT